MMKFVVLLAATFCASCSLGSIAHTYSNEELGLSITYPSSWVDIRKVKIRKVPQDQLNAGMSAEEAEKFVSGLAFGIAKVAAGDKRRNPNLIVAATPISEVECAKVNSSSFVRQEADQYVSDFPGAALVEDSHVTPPAKINGYTIAIPFHDRTVLQHKYFYRKNRHYVVITTASSSPDDEVEIRGIVSTISVAGL